MTFRSLRLSNKPQRSIKLSYHLFSSNFHNLLGQHYLAKAPIGVYKCTMQSGEAGDLGGEYSPLPPQLDRTTLP